MAEEEKSIAFEILKEMKEERIQQTEKCEKQNKRLFIICIVLAVALFVSNAINMWAWCQYDYESSSVTVESKDSQAIYTEKGDVNFHGENNGKENEKNP